MTDRITFDENVLHPSKTHASVDASGVDVEHGIVFSRTISTSKNSLRSRSMTRRGSKGRSFTADEEDPEAASMPTDFKVKQTFSGRQLLFLAYQSIGVIYGDIGTSPLYVYSSTFTDDPANDDLVGVLSLIIWSLLIVVTLKYIIIILHADNEGEGGTFSTYSLLARYANITNVDPKEKSLRMERHKTNEIPLVNRKVRNGLEKSLFARGLLKAIGVFAVSMVMSDGVLTPAQSVLGAVQGLNVATTVSNGTVVGVTCAILILLFLVQPFGTTKLAVSFAPIIIIWLGLNGGIGIYNIAKYDWTVLRAFNPGYAFIYLIRNGHDGWLSLGGVLLAFTGVEALFADLGAFSMHAIQLSWLGWCLPMLLLTYIGQAAYISVYPDAYAYPVFYTAPNGMVIPMIVFAVLAAIVASQAIITATFQLLAQITKLSYFPTIKIIHTSKIYHNQLFVPLVNWLLMIGTVLVAAIYNNTTSLGNAYGVCVMFVTFFDTIMVTLVSLIVWRKPWWLIALPALAIACIDGTFLSSALTKVPDGAWFTLTLAAVLASVFILWRFGKEQQWNAEAKDRIPISKFVREADDKLKLVQHGDEEIGQMRGFGVFFDKVGDKTPIVFSQFIEKLVTLPEISVWLNLRAVETPTVPDSERYWVSKMKLANTYRLVIRHGYMDDVITADLAAVVFQQIRKHILTKDIDRSAPALLEAAMNARKDADNASDEEKKLNSPVDTELVIQPDGEAVSKDLAFLENAYASRVLYVVGKEDMFISKTSPYWRKFLLWIFLFIRYNTRGKMQNLPLPRDRLVEIGFVKEI